MSLHGYDGALASVGLTLKDVHLVEVGAGQDRTPDANARDNYGSFWPSFEPLARGEVDAIYVKGAPAADGAAKHGFVVGIDLDKLPERRFRVNNGTPRPVTVHEYFLEHHYDLLVRFLRQTLRAAEWAKTNLKGVQEILQSETGATAEGVAKAYRAGFHQSLAPDLSADRVDLFRQQKDFLLVHGVLDRDFDLDAWMIGARWKKRHARSRTFAPPDRLHFRDRLESGRKSTGSSDRCRKKSRGSVMSQKKKRQLSLSVFVQQFDTRRTPGAGRRSTPVAIPNSRSGRASSSCSSAEI